LGSIVTNAARCTREIKWKNAVFEAVFKKKKKIFLTNKLDLNLHKMPHFERSLARFLKLDTSVSR